MVTWEGRKAFLRQKGMRPIPDEGAPQVELLPKRNFWGQLKYERVERGFERSSEAVRARRKEYRVGLPRVLNAYSTGPFFRTFFEVAGLAPTNIVWSSPTTEEMWKEGGKYGSVDPCFPAKVVQAHIHELLFHKHEKKAIDSIFFPVITHVPSFVEESQDKTSCPIVAGTPDVIKASFTKEVDFFAQRDIEYLAPALSFDEPVRMKQTLFETFGERLGLTRDESDFCVDEGFAALERFDAECQRMGREILDAAEASASVVVLMLGRPYHLDPGLHHGIPEELQALGYPVLSIRSIPKDPAYLARFFAEDLEAGHVGSALSVTDVWPENYSANSAQKVWAAKFAARHPNVVLLDLSSFKCGHDSPTYGIIDGIVKESAVPHSALHDIDANKPGGSIKIRVKTFAHSLKLYQERLEDLAAKEHELSRRVGEKRLELFRMKQAELEARSAHDEALEARIRELSAQLEDYKPALRGADEDVDAGLVQLGRKKKPAGAGARASA